MTSTERIKKVEEETVFDVRIDLGNGKEMIISDLNQLAKNSKYYSWVNDLIAIFEGNK